MQQNPLEPTLAMRFPDATFEGNLQNIHIEEGARVFGRVAAGDAPIHISAYVTITSTGVVDNRSDRARSLPISISGDLRSRSKIAGRMTGGHLTGQLMEGGLMAGGDLTGQLFAGGEMHGGDATGQIWGRMEGGALTGQLFAGGEMFGGRVTGQVKGKMIDGELVGTLGEGATMTGGAALDNSHVGADMSGGTLHGCDTHAPVSGGEARHCVINAEMSGGFARSTVLDEPLQEGDRRIGAPGEGRVGRAGVSGNSRIVTPMNAGSIAGFNGLIGGTTVDGRRSTGAEATRSSGRGSASLRGFFG